MLFELGLLQSQLALSLGLSTHLLLLLLRHLFVLLNLLKHILKGTVVLWVNKRENWLVLVVWLRHGLQRLERLATKC